jgi:hypothetical protein
VVVITSTLKSAIASRRNLRGRGVKSQRRLAVLAALGGTVALAGWVATELAGLGSLVIESTGASIKVRRATSATARAEHVDAPQATALGGDGVSVANTGRGDVALSDPPSDAAAGGGTCRNRVVKHA